MKLKKNYIFWVALSLILIVSAVLIFMKFSGPEGKACTFDSDCVPASCCHPMLCISKEFAPVCDGVACTMECAPNTLDCGQGSCICQDGICLTDMK